MQLTGSASEVDDLRPLLSASEQGRADRYRFDRHRRAYILGRAALRLLLSRYTGRPAARICFDYGEWGKPSLADGPVPRLCFNYSDAGGRALYGFARDFEIGVDVEDLNREVSFERIVQRRFSESEARAILGMPDGKRKAAFLACWTRKEGYGKAEGWGINYPLDSVELCSDCEADRVDLTVDGGGKWVVRQIYPSRDFVGTVVYPGTLETGGDPIAGCYQATPVSLRG